jgi:cytochrome d ubiquinol oxidase subunit I
MHAVTMWLVAIGSNLSALWILIANSFMQHPVGYEIQGPRAVMTDFGALVFNPYVWHQFPHTVLSGFTTGAFFVLGISAYHLVKKQNETFFKNSFRIAAIFGSAAILLTLLVGHSQTQYMVKTQPMKIAAAEALWRSENPASFSLFTVGDEEAREDVFAIRIPGVLSLLSYNQFSGEVKGIRDLQAEYETKYGPGNYVPSVITAYWSFRGMVGTGMLMLAAAAFALFQVMKNKPFSAIKLLAVYPFLIALPFIANSTGWILTETGRQPWAVFGVLKTADAVSPTVTVGLVLTSLIVFTLLYGALMVADVYLLAKFAKAGPAHAAAAHAKPAKTEESYWK